MIGEHKFEKRLGDEFAVQDRSATSGPLPRRHALVFGATGFLGRHLVRTLLDQAVPVTAACRSEASFDDLSRWLARHGCDMALGQLGVDFGRADLGVAEPGALQTVTEIYNCAGAYRFGMTQAEARRANVDSVRAIVALAASLGGVHRLVHVSGYRVGGQDPAAVPWPEARVRRTYRALGAYEASKVEADAVLQAEAERLGVLWSIVNPCTVSGVAATGESDQYLGLAATFRELWRGTLAARPGNAKTFVPVVPVDFLARFMAQLPTDPATRGASFWLLDDATPTLPDLLRLVGSHYRVRVPAARIPVGLVKRLPRSLTNADPETLSFLSTDRYPVRPAEEFAARHGLRMPPTRSALLAWADHLAAHRFGDMAAGSSAEAQQRRFTEYAGVRTFEIGPRGAADVLVLPGLPVNADTWQDVAAPIGARVVDLPGLGMSGGDAGDWTPWLDALLHETGARHLVGHSIGAAAAVEAAARMPGQVDSLTLIAPFFLQEPAGRGARASLLARAYLRCAGPGTLSRRLTGTATLAAALRSTVADLRRPGAAGRAASLLRHAADQTWRAELSRQLAGYPGLVHVIVGAQDPLAGWAPAALRPLGSRATITTIEAGGHHLQLTHPTRVAAAIAEADAARTGGGEPPRSWANAPALPHGTAPAAVGSPTASRSREALS